VCDGCGEAIQGEPVKVGHVLRRDYCPDCDDVAQEYQNKIDELHTALSERWGKETVTLRSCYGKKLRLLPDVSP